MKVLRRTGKFLKNRFQIFWGIGIVCLFISLLLIVISFPKSPIYINLGQYAFPMGMLSVLFLVYAIYSRKKYRDFKKGFDGEQKVSNYLESKMGNDYCLINDAKLLNSNENVDHIILAPNGIFVLETKNVGGTIIFKKGDSWNFGRSPVSQVRSNAYAVFDMILNSNVLKMKPESGYRDRRVSQF